MWILVRILCLENLTEFSKLATSLVFELKQYAHKLKMTQSPEKME